MFRAHFSTTEVNLSCILHVVSVLGQVRVEGALWVYALRDLFASLPRYVLIVARAVLTLCFLYGYLLQFYVFGVFFVAGTGTVYVGVQW